MQREGGARDVEDCVVPDGRDLGEWVEPGLGGGAGVGGAGARGHES